MLDSSKGRQKQNWLTQYDLPQETTSREKTALTAWQQLPVRRREATIFCPSFTSEWCIKKLEPLLLLLPAPRRERSRAKVVYTSISHDEASLQVFR